MKNLFFLLLAVLLLTACGQNTEKDRGAVSVNITAEEVLADKNQLILVYCRSGRRSKLAAEALVELGYKSPVQYKTELGF